MNYRLLQGDSFDLGDWCDKTIYNRIKTNNFLSGYGARSDYTTTYRFMDFIIGGDTIVDIWNLQLENRQYNTPFTINSRQGLIIKDSTYNHNHGSVTLTTSPKWSSDTAVGLGSMEFNGVSNFIKIPKYKQGNDATISMWVKGTITTGYYVLLGSYSSIAIGFWDRRIRRNNWYRFSPTGDLSTNFINGEWNHIVVKRESNGDMKYFCNGILLSNTTNNVWTTDSLL